MFFLSYFIYIYVLYCILLKNTSSIESKINESAIATCLRSIVVTPLTFFQLSRNVSSILLLVLKFSSRGEGWKMHGQRGHATSRIRVDDGIGLSKVSDP